MILPAPKEPCDNTIDSSWPIMSRKKPAELQPTILHIMRAGLSALQFPSIPLWPDIQTNLIIKIPFISLEPIASVLKANIAALPSKWILTTLEEAALGGSVATATFMAAILLGRRLQWSESLKLSVNY